jgi:predicted peptidase
MKKLFTFFFILCSYCAFTQDFTLCAKKEYKSSNGKVLPYRILYPEQYDKSKKYPLILFLHGAGERGSENEKQLTHGASLFIADSNRKNFPCFVVFPQCPVDSAWSSVKIDRSKTPLAFHFDYTALETWPLHAAIELVKKIANEESVDKSRLYITGLSMGGMGTFEAEYRYPNMFAAAMPICGGGDTTYYDKRVEKTSFWIFHGGSDSVVNVEESKAMVRKLHASGVDVKYTEYPGVGHNSWDNAFAEPTFLSWMFAHKRNDVRL